MSYTDFCLAVGGNCPGGPEQCLLDPQPTNPEVCSALEAVSEEDPPEIDPPG